MTRVQPNRSRKLFTMPRTGTAMAAVCIVLLALMAFVQVAHVHPVASDTDNCPLCIVLHSAAPVTAAVAAIIFVTLGKSAPVAQERPALRSWNPYLFTRPPPVG